MFLEHVEIYALFGRTKWTQNLRWEDQNRFQGPGFPLSHGSQGNNMIDHLLKAKTEDTGGSNKKAAITTTQERWGEVF